MFNKDTNLKKSQINFPSWLNNLEIVKWIPWDSMTDDEKAQNDCFNCGGYCKSIEYKQAWTNLWKSITKEQKKEIEKLPNFDAKIFKEITGIKI